MNAIITVVIGIMASLYGTSFPPLFSDISKNLLYDSRVTYSIQYFGGEHDRNLRNIGTNIVYAAKDWKRNRSKDIRPYLGTKKITLNIWLFKRQENDFKTALEVFQENVPNIEISTKTFTSETEYLSALTDAFHSTNTPDAFLMSSGWWPDFRQFAEPFPEKLFSLEECLDFFFSFSCLAFSSEGKMQAVPLFVEPLVMLVNQKMLQDDRVAVSDRPSNLWSGFLDNGQKLSKYLSKNSILTTLKTDSDTYTTEKIFQTLLLQVQKKEVITKDTIIELLDFMKKIDDFAFPEVKKSASIRKSGKDAYTKFLEGESAVLFGIYDTYEKLLRYLLSAGEGKIQKSDIGIFAVPRIKNDDTGVSAGEAWALAVPKNAPNREAALGLLTFLAEEESSESFAKNTGKIPARKSVAEFNIFREIALDAKNPLGRTGTFDFQQNFSENLTALFDGNMTPEEMADFILLYIRDYDAEENISESGSGQTGGRNPEGETDL